MFTHKQQQQPLDLCWFAVYFFLSIKIIQIKNLLVIQPQLQKCCSQIKQMVKHHWRKIFWI